MVSSAASALRLVCLVHLAPVGDACLVLHVEHMYIRAFPRFVECVLGSGAMLRTSIGSYYRQNSRLMNN